MAATTDGRQSRREQRAGDHFRREISTTRIGYSLHGLGPINGLQISEQLMQVAGQPGIISRTRQQGGQWLASLSGSEGASTAEQGQYLDSEQNAHGSDQSTGTMVYQPTTPRRGGKGSFSLANCSS